MTAQRQLPGRTVSYSQRPDAMVLLWLLMPLEVICGALTDAIGWWAFIPAGLFVVALIAAVTWSLGGREL